VKRLSLLVAILAVVAVVVGAVIFEDPKIEGRTAPTRECPLTASRSIGITAGDMATGPDGRLWYAAPDAIGAYDLKTNDTADFRVPPGPAAPASKAPYGIHGFKLGSDGKLWFAGLAGLIGTFDPATHKSRVFRDGISSGSLPVHLEEARGRFYFTEYNGGVGFIDAANPRKATDISEGLPPHPTPHGIVRDKDDNLWIALQGADQIAHLNTQTNTYDKFVKFSKNSGPHNIRIDPSGIVYVTLQYSSKIGEYNPRNGHVKEYAVDLPKPTSKNSLAFEPKLVDLERPARGDVYWITTFSDRLFTFDPKTKEIKACTIKVPLPAGAAEAGVTTRPPVDAVVAFRGPDQHVWITDLLSRTLLRVSDAGL
jgi:streptogramin lyase